MRAGLNLGDSCRGGFADLSIGQKRLIATSALVFGQWWTFGDGPEREGGKSCTVARGVLEPRAPALPDF
jgi:hypothetical protein